MFFFPFYIFLEEEGGSFFSFSKFLFFIRENCNVEGERSRIEDEGVKEVEPPLKKRETPASKDISSSPLN